MTQGEPRPHTDPADPSRRVLSCDDVDEARELLGRLYTPMHLRPLGSTEKFRLKVDARRLGPVMISAVFLGSAMETAADALGYYNVNLVLAGELTGRHEGEKSHAGAGHAVLNWPVGRVSAVNCPGSHMMSLGVERGVLERELEALLLHPVRGPVRFSQTMDLTSGAGAHLATMMNALYRQLGNDSVLTRHPLMAGHLWRSLLDGLLAAADHPYRDELMKPVSPSRPSSVNRVTDAIHAEPYRPYTVADLATIGRTSIRSLQEGFRRHIGMTPMTYLKQVRLSCAHEQLRTADPAQITVATVAYDWGFNHLGRFSHAYRRRYGVPPSTTLKQEF